MHDQLINLVRDIAYHQYLSYNKISKRKKRDHNEKITLTICVAYFGWM